MAFSVTDSRPSNPLDRIRILQGTDNLRLHFRNLAKKNLRDAVRLLNDDSLNFASLFSLRAEITGFGLLRFMNSRNTAALNTAERILGGRAVGASRLSRVYGQEIKTVLKWIFNSRAAEEQGSPEHEHITDIAALILVKTFRDNSILGGLTDLIFDRNRAGKNNYDLIWAAFETCNPEVLVRISERLMSPDEKDKALANRLLGFIPCSGTGDTGVQSLDKINWLKRNYNFLYYTGESLHQSCSPIPFAVSLEAKYINKPVSHEGGKFLEPLSDTEKKLLDGFKGLNAYSRDLLSEYSFLLFNTNRGRWHEWIRLPLTEQVLAAVRSKGGLL